MAIIKVTKYRKDVSWLDLAFKVARKYSKADCEPYKIYQAGRREFYVASANIEVKADWILLGEVYTPVKE